MYSKCVSDGIKAGLSIVWLNSNFAGHYKRATALGLVYSVGNSSGIVVGQIFKATEAPRYRRGSSITIGFAAFGMVLVVVNVLALMHVNKKREQRMRDRNGEPEGRNMSKEYTDYDATFRYNL